MLGLLLGASLGSVDGEELGSKLNDGEAEGSFLCDGAEDVEGASEGLVLGALLGTLDTDGTSDGFAVGAMEGALLASGKRPSQSHPSGAVTILTQVTGSILG